MHRAGGFVATIYADGTVSFGARWQPSLDSDAPVGADGCGSLVGPRFRPSLDLNDIMLRMVGDDPLAAKKRRFLRLTQSLRDDMSKRAQTNAQRHAYRRLKGRLQRVWEDGRLSLGAKRQVLFALWDESLEEKGERQGDEPATGREARELIIETIKQKMPQGSAEAYSEAELRALNHRRTRISRINIPLH